MSPGRLYSQPILATDSPLRQVNSYTTKDLDLLEQGIRQSVYKEEKQNPIFPYIPLMIYPVSAIENTVLGSIKQNNS